MFRTVPLSIIRSLLTVHSAMVYVILVYGQLSSSSILVLLQSCLQICMTYTIAECTVNKLLMMVRGTAQNMCWSKFGKLLHLVGFIIKKYVTMHGHMNVKFVEIY